jgi:hypothetical protein
MEKPELNGSLKKRPLSFLLFDLWALSKPGQLTLKDRSQTKTIDFIEEKIAVGSDIVDSPQFRRFVSESESVDRSLLEQCDSYAKQNNMSWIKAAIHLNILNPKEIWLHIRDHSFSDLLCWFDSEEATYSFNPNHPVDKSCIYSLLPLLDVILEGTRQMQNFGLIQTHIPDQKTGLLALHPRHMEQLDLLPHEQYLFQLISCLPGTKDIYEKSELGLKETQRSLFLFSSLGLISLPEAKMDSDSGKSLLQEDLDRILAAFDKKCTATFKYIVKEIGPVSVNILEKTLEEAKIGLSPLFQKAKLLSDGRIDFLSPWKPGSHFLNAESQRALLTGLNEILVAEVLAVKKILGEEHEAALIKNLKRIET